MKTSRRVTLARISIAIVICLLVTGCHVFDFLFGAFFFSEFGVLGDILIEISVSDPNDGFLPYNDYLDGELLFVYGARIDVDNAVSTGDAEGYDVDIRVEYHEGTIFSTAAGEEMGLGDMMLDSSYHGDLVVVPVDNTRVEIGGESKRLVAMDETGTIFVGASTTEDMFDGLVEDCRTQFYTRFNIPTDPSTFAEDLSDVIVGSGSVDDPAGDVPTPMTDLLSVRIEFP